MVKSMEMNYPSRQRPCALAALIRPPLWLANSLATAGLLLLGLLLLNLLNSVSAMASADSPLRLNPDWPGSGTMQLFNDAGEVAPPKLATQVDMQINGWTNRVTVTQSYTNASEQWLHGRYLFPLPENAAVDSLNMQIGERVIEGQIQPKQKAKQMFEQAKAQGQQASLLSQQRPNLFTAEVANLGPGQTIKVQFSYQQQVEYREGALSVRFPMTYTPRYVPQDYADVDDAADIMGDFSYDPTPVSAAADNGSVSINLDLHAGVPLATATSPSHPLTKLADDGDQQQFKFANMVADRDFIFSWQPANGNTPQAALFSQQGQTHPLAETGTQAAAPQDYSLLMLMPPQSKPEQPMPRDLVLVVDTSGSMSGASMQQAKEAVRFALTSLRPQDSFNVLAFSSDVSALAPQSLPATATNIGRAQQFVAQLQANGGTEMGRALDAALPSNYQVPQGVLRQVIFMTDGAVGNEKQLFNFIHQRLGDSRLFTVGIGSAPNAYFMKRAAEAGRGTFTYIGYGEDVSTKTVALLEKIAAPVVTDVQLRFADGTVPDYWPAQIPDLYLGEPVVVSIKQARGRHSSLTISGNVAGQFWQQQLTLTPEQRDSGLDLLWARGQIGALELAQDDSNRDRTEQQVTALAMKYHLVSQYTSLVAVDVTPVNPNAPDTPQAEIASKMPAGWQPPGNMPQTASNSRLLLLLGALMLLLGGALCWLSRHPKQQRCVS
ncbi:marine proteobacterial sortase target protein [Shewanella sp. A3A]|nr:marine proteobacterial sortase target protein [Shewanella ferrihydritica]